MNSKIHTCKANEDVDISSAINVDLEDNAAATSVDDHDLSTEMSCAH